jgi:HK97 gp10 family phage protein
MANDIIGLKECRKLFEDAGKAPAKVLTKATKSAGKVIQTAAKSNAPEDEGTLKKAIKLKAEKAKKGKRVYQVWVDANPDFVKYSKEGERSFYPASQEYGWTRNGKYTPGFRYMHKAADTHYASAKAMMLRVMASELEKLR